MSDTYILVGNKVVREPNVIKWGQWFSTANRVVKKTQVSQGVEVSTVFLGLDYNFGTYFSSPLLFETMIFGGERDQELCDRYSTWDEAVRGHDRIVAEFNQPCGYCGTLRKADEVKCHSCGGNF